MVKDPCANAGDLGLIPRLGRSPGEDNGNPLQYSCLGNPMDKEAWQAVVNGTRNSWTRLSMHAEGAGILKKKIREIIQIKYGEEIEGICVKGKWASKKKQQQVKEPFV